MESQTKGEQGERGEGGSETKQGKPGGGGGGGNRGLLAQAGRGREKGELEREKGRKK